MKKYISDEKFRELSKEEKLSLPMYTPEVSEKLEVKQLILFPTKRKSSGYTLGAFFARNDNGWIRLMDYDCWQIVTDIENPAKFRFQILKGDFEHGGINIFGITTEHHMAYIDYGGQITIKNK